MKALRLYGRGDVRFDDVPDPGPLQPGDVLVAPLWCGLCGTDVREYRGPGGATPDEPHPLTGVTRPLIFGHEFSARVVAVGAPVAGLEVGDRVAVMPLLGCGTCAACGRGEAIFCVTKAWTGLSTAYGGLGDLAIIPAAQAVPIHTMTDEEGALVEPAAVALQAVLRAGVTGGDTVLVTGFGPIGALAALAALALGATKVLVSEPRTELADKIASIGAQLIAPGPVADQVAAIELLAPEGVRVSIDCAGKPESLDLCIAATAAGGTIGVPSVHTERRSIDVWRMTRHTLRLAGSLGYTRDTWLRTIALIEAGRYPVAVIHTHSIERDAVAHTLGTPPAADDRQLKVLVRVGH